MSRSTKNTAQIEDPKPAEIFMLRPRYATLKAESRWLASLSRHIRELQDLYRERSLALTERLILETGLSNDVEAVEVGYGDDPVVSIRIRGNGQ